MNNGPEDASASRGAVHLGAVLRDGGMTVATPGPDGTLLMRSVVQLDGDVITWVDARLVAPNAAAAAVVDRHFDAVAAATADFGAAAMRAVVRIDRWLSRFGRLARYATWVSAGGAATGGAAAFARAHVAWIAAPLAVTAVGLVIRFVVLPFVRQRLEGEFARWRS